MRKIDREDGIRVVRTNHQFGKEKMSWEVPVYWFCNKIKYSFAGLVQW